MATMHTRPVKRTSEAMTKGQISPARSRSRLKWFLCLLLVAALVAMVTVPLRSDVSINPPPTQSISGLTSYYDLMELDEKALEQNDIAVMNLLCAQGLPGAQDLSTHECQATLDDWARHVKAETVRHFYKFKQSPGEYQNSLAYFNMLMLVTVLQQDFGIHYNSQRANDPDFTNSKDLFIHGLLGQDRTGTCLSMPVLYIAVGRRLGYPLHLVQNRMHLFVRWEDGRERLNIEATSQGIICRDDSYYASWPEPLTKREVASGAYLRNLTASEELAVFMSARGHCLEDTGRLPEAQVAYALAHLKAPAFPNGLGFLTAAIERERPTLGAHSFRPRRLPERAPSDYRSIDELNEYNRQLQERFSALPPGIQSP